MLDTIEGKLGGAAFEPTGIPVTSRLRQFLESIPVTPSQPFEDLGFRILEGIFPQMALKANEVVAERMYTSEIYARDIERLRGRLDIAVPPNEYDDTGEPASFAGILNAAWHFYLEDSDLLPGADLSGAEAKERFYEMISWALEAAELSLAWSEASQKVKDVDAI